MIGKAKSNRSLSGTIHYNEKKGAELFYTHNLEGETLHDFRMQMQDLQKCYSGNARQLTIHAILSPSIEDGKRLTQKGWQKIADQYLKNMNIEMHQVIGFFHTDKEHRHLHLIINKVNEQDFTLYHDGFIGKKSQKAADAIAKEMGLTRARLVQQERLKTKQRNRKTEKLADERPVGAKQQFENHLKKITQNKYSNVETYFKALEREGFIVHRYFNKSTNELRGYGIERDGAKMDASAVNKQFTLKVLGLTGEKSIVKDTGKINAPIEELSDLRKIKILKNYAEEMGITENTLQEGRVKFLQQGSTYFIGMQNDSGGYATINPFSQDNTGKNDITTIIEDEETPTIVVESAMDYLQHKQQPPNTPKNYIILNGGHNMYKVIEKIKSLGLQNVKAHFSDDPYGKRLLKKFSEGLLAQLSIDRGGDLSRDNEMPVLLKKRGLSR